MQIIVVLCILSIFFFDSKEKKVYIYLTFLPKITPKS